MSPVRPVQVCPSCGDDLEIQRLSCVTCGTVVEGGFRWPRLARLSREDQQLVELMILASGSLKAVAKQLGISYPTMRKRLDALIAHLEAEVKADEEYRQALLREVEAGTQTPADATARIDKT